MERFIVSYPEIGSVEISKRKEFSDLKLGPRREQIKPGEMLYSQKYLSRMFSPETMNRKVLLHHEPGTGKCCLPGTIVTTQEGEFAIEFLWYNYSGIVYRDKEGQWSSPSSSLFVKSKDNKLVEVFHLYKQYVQEFIREFVFTDGTSFSCTKLHKLFKDNEFTTEINKGDIVSGKTISSITERFYNGWVYDLEVDTHMYLCNGILCHNTCAAYFIAENFKYKHQRALVLVPSKNIMEEHLEQLAHTCKPDLYAPAAEENIELHSISEKIRIGKAVKEYYELDTIERYLKKNVKGKSVENLSQENSGRTIIIDEVHETRIQKKKKNKKQQISNYKRLHRLCHSVGDDGIVILLTATPIVDSADEYAAVLNLILPEGEQQLPTEGAFIREFFDRDTGDLTDTGTSRLREAMKGRVSYLRALVSDVERVYHGVIYWTEHQKIVPCVMSSFQAKVLREASERKDVKKKGSGETGEGGAVRIHERMASDFVYPDGTYGKEGYQKHMSKNGVFKEETALAVRENLGKYSTKYQMIYDLWSSDKRKLTAVYIELVTGSGAEALAACLRTKGFTKIGTKFDIENAEKRPRFALLTSEEKGQRLFGALFHPLNRYGEYIAIIIFSAAFSRGVTMKNVRRFIDVGPQSSWSLAAIDQAQGRVIRYLSHQDLPEEEREIDIYNLAVVFGEEDLEATIDIDIYRDAEQKDYANSRIYRVEKEEAFDCANNYNRNVLPQDVDGSRACDYQECNYLCSGGFVPDKDDKVWTYDLIPVDRETYDLLYANDESQQIEEHVRDLFSRQESYTFDELQTEQGDELVLLLTLEKMIDNNVVIRDRYGLPAYLREEGDLYFLVPSVLSKSYLDSFYTSNVIVTDSMTLEEIVELETLEMEKPKIEIFCENPSVKNLYDFDPLTRILAIEALKKKGAVTDDLGKAVDAQVYEMDDGVFVHNLYSDLYTGVSYNVTAKTLAEEGKLRVLPVDGEWRWATPEEEKDYIAQIRLLKSSGSNVVCRGKEDLDLVGIFSYKDREFRLIDKQRPTKKGKTGLACSSVKKNDLLKYFERLGYYPVPDDAIDLTEKELRNGIQRALTVEKKGKKGKQGEGETTFLELEEDLDIERLQSIYYLVTSKVDVLCKLLQEYMEENNMMCSTF